MRPEDSFGMVLANVLDSLRSRGVQDVLIACTDNLIGFAAAIKAVTPKTEIQNCIIHQPRNLSQYVSYKDLKATRAAAAEQAALVALEIFAEHWDKKSPKISQPCRDNWADLRVLTSNIRRRYGD